MASLQTRIQQASAKNAELLRIIAETDHAPPDLESQRRFVADLASELDDARARIRKLDQQRERELHDHEKYRDSVMRRFAYKATGQRDKFAAKAEREECEYFAVLQEEQREKEMEQNLDDQLTEARRVEAELQGKVERHRVCQAELDNLYHAIFAGPTPEFPDEDEKERASEASLQRYHDARMRAEAQLRAAKTLKQAGSMLQSATLAMAEAQSHSRMDMFGGGSMSDMMERNALHKADRLVLEARHQVAMAQREDPQIMSLRDVNINTGSLMSDVFFDNIYTDMAFHDEIKRGRAELDRARKAVDQSLGEATTRYRACEQLLREREGELESTRFALQKAREQAFEKVLASTK